MVGDKAVVVLEHVTRVHDDIGPDWPQPAGKGCYRVEIKGEPNYTLDLQLLGTDGDHNTAGLKATAMRLVNAVPAVVDAKPGLDHDTGPAAGHRPRPGGRHERAPRPDWSSPPLIAGSLVLISPATANAASTCSQADSQAASQKYLDALVDRNAAWSIPLDPFVIRYENGLPTSVSAFDLKLAALPAHPVLGLHLDRERRVDVAARWPRERHQGSVRHPGRRGGRCRWGARPSTSTSR